MSVWTAWWIRGAPPGGPFRKGIGSERGQSGQQVPQLSALSGPASAAESGLAWPTLGGYALVCDTLMVGASHRAPSGPGASFGGAWSQLTLCLILLPSSHGCFVPKKHLPPKLCPRVCSGKATQIPAGRLLLSACGLTLKFLISLLVMFPFKLSFRLLCCNINKKCLSIWV